MPTTRAYEFLTAEDDGRVCRDIPESACAVQPSNFLTHVLSLAATKTGDGLVDPKLVLSWLLTTLGASPFVIGLLVPIREAGSLLPQLFVAGTIRARPQRKWVWVAGSIIQGIAVFGMAAAAWWLGPEAVWAIVGLLGVFAVARSLCSVSYKDVLGKTVSKSTRGTATGSASTVAAILVLAFGFALSTGVLQRSVATIGWVLVVAGLFWLGAAALFATLREEPGATEGGGNPFTVVREQISLLVTDDQLRRFIITRALLLATALAPPFLLALAGRASGRQLGELGPFVIASALASVSSTYAWGRLSDRSSRTVLAASAAVAGVALTVAGLAGRLFPDAFNAAWFAPSVLFVMMIAHQGVRLGRATHIVDMANASQRATYTALSNTAIGVLLVGASVFGVIAQAAGEPVVLLVFAVMCAAAVVAAWGLEEVQ